MATATTPMTLAAAILAFEAAETVLAQKDQAKAATQSQADGAAAAKVAADNENAQAGAAVAAEIINYNKAVDDVIEAAKGAKR